MIAGASSASEAELGTERLLEPLEAAEGDQLRHVGFAAEGGEHAREVGGRGDRGPQALADRLSCRRAAEIVVAAARARRLGNDLELARGAAQLERRLLTDGRFVEGDRLLVDAGSVEVFERECEAAEVLGADRGSEVDAVL